ncbi:MAG TPA: hypothetical protein DCM07_02115 [Planctomycetaceae bacterium]|nr:hypothetical protein [Planctomycetaceae bacterium]
MRLPEQQAENISLPTSKADDSNRVKESSAFACAVIFSTNAIAGDAHHFKSETASLPSHQTGHGIGRLFTIDLQQARLNRATAATRRIPIQSMTTV